MFRSSTEVIAAVLVGLVAIVFLASCSLSAGAQMCPAAAASTIFTSVSMALSFAGQTLLYHEVPEALSIFGAGLLLTGVACMAAARKLYPASANPTTNLSTTVTVDG